MRLTPKEMDRLTIFSAAELARSGRHRTVVTLLSDGGERYLSTGMWDHEASAGGTDHA